MGLNLEANSHKTIRIEAMFREIEQKLAKYVEGKRKLLGIAVHGLDKQYINEVVAELESKGFVVEVVETDLQTDIQFSWE